MLTDKTLKSHKALLYYKINRANAYIYSTRIWIAAWNVDAALMRIDKAIELLIETRKQLEASGSNQK